MARLDKHSQLDAVWLSEVAEMERGSGGEVKKEGSRDGGVSRRVDVPDSVDVLDGVADLLAELFLIELHLQTKRGRQEGFSTHTLSVTDP